MCAPTVGEAGGRPGDRVRRRGVSVLLVTGPGGSGKSTLAQAVADRLGWTYVSEDERWVRNGWGSGLRSPDHERIVQEQVGQDVLAAHRAGRGAVLEFILYRPPPNPLTAYQELLAAHGISGATVVLRPTVEEVLRRMAHRGRPSDADLDARRLDAEGQVGILELGFVDPGWVVDPTDRTVDELVEECATRLGGDP